MIDYYEKYTKYKKKYNDYKLKKMSGGESDPYIGSPESTENIDVKIIFKNKLVKLKLNNISLVNYDEIKKHIKELLNITHNINIYVKKDSIYEKINKDDIIVGAEIHIC
jgi:hypothetical protein